MIAGVVLGMNRLAQSGPRTEISLICATLSCFFSGETSAPSHALLIAETNAPVMKPCARSLPYVLSWGVLACLMIFGMARVPLWLYSPVDGDWAKWNAEAILHFSRVLDLSPYSMLAGMGSMYAPNLPWLNPGALALALPLGDNTTSIVSYAIYGVELA